MTENAKKKSTKCVKMAHRSDSLGGVAIVADHSAAKPFSSLFLILKMHASVYAKEYLQLNWPEMFQLSSLYMTPQPQIPDFYEFHRSVPS